MPRLSHANTMPTHANGIDRTGGRGLQPRPPCAVNKIIIYGHGVGMSLFGLGGQTDRIYDSLALKAK